MRPSVVVVLAVLLDQNLRFNQVGERLPLEQLIPKASDERLRIGILPGGTRLDVQSLHLRERQPLLERSGYEFGAVVRPSHVLDGGSSLGRAQKFPRLTSLRMLMSTAWSATIFFKRAFSFSSSFRRFISSDFTLPYWFLQRWKVASLMTSFVATLG